MLEDNGNSQNSPTSNQISNNSLPNNGINTNTVLLIIIAILLTAIVAGGGVYLYLTSSNGNVIQPGPQTPPELLQKTESVPRPTEVVQITKSPTTILTPTIKPSALLYDNAEFGFTLTFPETWKGFVYNKKSVDFGWDTNPWVMYFGLPTQSDIFAIGIYTKGQWQLLQASEGPKDQYLGENANYVFGSSLGQYATNDEMAKRRNEVGNIIKTFKLK